jgi:hypothetical protein
MTVREALPTVQGSFRESSFFIPVIFNKSITEFPEIPLGK